MSESGKNIESSKLPGIYLKDRQRHLDQGHVSEKNYTLKNNRRAYIGKTTANINKLTKYMDLGNKSRIEFETCLQKLQKYKHKVKTVSESLIESRTPVDPFMDHLVEGKEILIPHVTQFFTPQKAIKHELEIRYLPPVDLLHFEGNPVHWPEFIDNLYHRIRKNHRLTIVYI